MCGVFGVVLPPGGDQSAAAVASLGLFALQHRGQESAGVAVSDGEQLMLYKDLGMIASVLDERRLPSLRGGLAIAHCRYSTTGSTIWENAQPTFRLGPRRALAIGHNGNLVNTRELLGQLAGGRGRLPASTDTELLTALLADEPAADTVDALVRVLPRVHGAFSLVILEPGVEPRSVRFAPANPALCVFEMIYFARPDSYMEGRNLYEVRRRMGEELAREHPAETDLVMPVPDTGAPAAAGYAEISGIPFREGLIRNRYTGRTFIQPSQTMRHRGVTMKLNPLREVVRGKRLTVVDDSIVRGTTTAPTVAMLRRAGAREVHVRIHSPQMTYPCYMGVDTGRRSELIAANQDLEGIRRAIGADSLGYLSQEGLLAAVGGDPQGFCTACFDGRYPTDVPLELDKFALERG